MKAKTASLFLLPLLAAMTMSAGATPASTDEARAEAAQHNATVERMVSSQRSAPNAANAVRVTDTDSARQAAALANQARSGDQTGSGINPAPIAVTDTDSARAAAAQKRL